MSINHEGMNSYRGKAWRLRLELDPVRDHQIARMIAPTETGNESNEVESEMNGVIFGAAFAREINSTPGKVATKSGKKTHV